MFVMYDLAMKKIEFPKGITPLDIFISSIEKERQRESLEGSDGYVDYGSSYVDRDITLKLALQSTPKTYRILRNDLYSLFSLDDTFYLREVDDMGRRYLVTVNSRYTPERVGRWGAEATVDCSVVNLPFAESVGTTQDINREGINLNGKRFSPGMGLDGIGALYYTYTGLNFPVFNAGNVLVHPLEQYLKITIKNVQASTSFLQLKNVTNNSVIRFKKAIKPGDVIEINGPNVTINKIPSVRDTTWTMVDISPGWNDFQVTGATSAVVIYDYRFYYK